MAISPIVSHSVLPVTPTRNLQYPIGTETDIRYHLIKLKKALRASGGVGLAAPQVCIPWSIMVMKQGDKLIGLINPKLIQESDERQYGHEGCLSFEGESVFNQRGSSVVVGYVDETLIYVEKTFTGFDAVIFQHEYEHLLGMNMYSQHQFHSYDDYKLYRNSIRNNYVNALQIEMEENPTNFNCIRGWDYQYSDGFYFFPTGTLGYILKTHPEFRIKSLIVIGGS